MPTTTTLRVRPAVPASTVPTLPGELGRLGLDNRLTATTTDGTAVGASRVVDETVTWSRARGAFVVAGNLYHGWDDGTFQRRSLAGGTVGAATAIPTSLNTRTITGMYFDAGKLHYTVSGDSRLHWRWFTPESGVVGADDFVVTSPISWSDTSGLTLASGKLYWARGGDGALVRADVVDGLPVAASATVLSTSDWRSRGLTPLPGTPAPPPPGPTAAFASDFSSGMFGFNRVVGFTVDDTTGATAAPSARASVTGAPAIMRAALATPATSVCQSQAVKVDSLGATLVLARFKSSTGGAVGRLYLKSTGELVLRSDVNGAQAFSKVLLPLGTWNTVELCGTVGTAGTLQVKVNGTSVLSWTADLGTTAIGTVQVGDDAATTAALSVDDVRVTIP